MYYRGDYYGRGRGDYYRGDPFLGALAPIAGGLIKKGITALVNRAGARGATGAAAAIGAGAAIGAARRLTSSGGGIGLPQLGSAHRVPMAINPRAILPGGAPFIGAAEIPRGYHLAKDGSGRLVRNRRMNVTNPVALRRAIRRQDGFVQLAKRMGLVQRTQRVLRPKKGRKR